MKVLHYSTQYKKDFKRYRNNLPKLEKLLEVQLLVSPASFFQKMRYCIIGYLMVVI